ncbi:hypothetical protein FACS1894156_1340 [Bacteroidia bacterium]|nr:hypothetical protein FACS1894156_1340 [Bacteroidia bacterium]
METAVLSKPSRKVRKVVVNVEEQGYSFFMELLNNFSFVQVETTLPKQLSKENKAIIASIKQNTKDLKLYKQEKLKTVPVKDFLDDNEQFKIPEGYVTGDEFKRRVIEGLEKRLKENGYL